MLEHVEWRAGVAARPSTRACSPNEDPRETMVCPLRGTLAADAAPVEDHVRPLGVAARTPAGPRPWRLSA